MKKLMFSAAFAVLFGTAAMADGDRLMKQHIASDLADLLESTTTETRAMFMVSMQTSSASETYCAAQNGELGLLFGCRVKSSERAFQAETLALDISEVEVSPAPATGACAGAYVYLMPKQVVLRNICTIEGRPYLYVAVLAPLTK